MNNVTNDTKINQTTAKIICLLFAFLLLLCMEFISAKFLPPKDEMSQILQLLEEDSTLFWRQKPNIKQIFKNALITTNSLGLRIKNSKSTKPADTFKILCLGASPTFGWGVAFNDTYSQRLQKLLKEKYNGNKNIEVINGGNIGYSSYQGLKFFKKYISKLNPDIITVSYVINDVDKHRFYRSDGRSDAELGPKNRFLVLLENLLNKSHIYKLMRSEITSWKGLASKYFSQGSKGIYFEKRRVPLKNYKKNINQIINIAKNNNIKALLVKMPVNLPTGEDVSSDAESKANYYIVSALDHANKKEFLKAIDILKKALEYNPYSSKAYYFLGFYSEESKKFDEADQYFKKSKEMELTQCGRLAKIYNDAMQEISDKRDIPMVDIVSAFNAFSKKNNKYLFLDPNGDTIHPNALGHGLIARQLFDALIRYNLLNFQQEE